MKFRLAPDWSAVLRKAWSIRLLALAVLFEAAQYALPYLPSFAVLSPQVSALVVGGLMLAAGLARVVDQKNLAAPEAPVEYANGDIVIYNGRAYRAVEMAVHA